MATTNGGYSTSAGKDESELRQRNVSSYEKANGSTVYKLEAEDTKKLQKVCYDSWTFSVLTLTKPQPAAQKGLLETLDEWEWVIAPLVFTAFALFTRLWKIGLSNIVTWDEAQLVLLLGVCLRMSANNRQFWQIRLTLPQTRILLRCTPSTGQDACWSFWLLGWLQWFLRIQIW